MINSTKENGINTLTISAPPRNLTIGKHEAKIVSDSFHYKKFKNDNGEFRIAQIKVSYMDSKPFDLTVLSGEDDFASKYSKDENINCYIVETKAKNGKTYLNAEW